VRARTRPAQLSDPPTKASVEPEEADATAPLVGTSPTTRPWRLCLLLAEAADATSAEEELRDTWADEARLMIEMILDRTDQ
jgi:hypothetical protein